MAIDSKVSFINQTEKRLSTEITLSDMNKVLTVISDVMEGRTDDSPALFINRLHNRLRSDNVRDMLNVIAKIAGVEHVHPHKFRRTRATELARKGMSIQEVAHILGHEKIDTTMQYVMQNEDDIRHDFLRYAV